MSWPFQAENPADRASFLLFVSVHVRKAKDDARATVPKVLNPPIGACGM